MRLNTGTIEETPILESCFACGENVGGGRAGRPGRFLRILRGDGRSADVALFSGPVLLPVRRLTPDLRKPPRMKMLPVII